MKYMGSKNRHAREILSIISGKVGETDRWYVEPFCGGCNVIDKVSGNRIANDSHKYLIPMWKSLVYEKWIPPIKVSEDEYMEIKKHPIEFPMNLVGYVGFNSYGAKWFGGYRRDRIGERDYWREHYNNVMKQVPFLRGVKFHNRSYKDLYIPPKSIIYCDPPYENSTKYKDDFNHIKFWNWVREMRDWGHTIFVSEYTAPEDFVSIWEKKVNNTLIKDTGSKRGIEKIFIPRDQ